MIPIFGIEFFEWKLLKKLFDYIKILFDGVKSIMRISGNIVDLERGDIFPGTVNVEKNKIAHIEREDAEYDRYIIPGFVDAHIHIESSMLVPSEFARIAVVHGTVGVVSDPHEIANVLGISGIKYMIKNSKKTSPMKFFFGVPSCVPASPFENTGYTLGSEDVEKLLSRKDLYFLAEVMNYPGVINQDPEIINKIKAAKRYGKPVDGHAPGLTGEKLKKYIKAGISTDHECFTIKEAKEKIRMGMKILIRDGSAAHNFDDLLPLLEENYKSCMLCSDDKHPDDLIKGHINLLVKKAINSGIDPIKVLTAASYNPIAHYKLDIGLLREGDPADFLVVNNLNDLRILKTVIDGVEVATDEGSNIEYIKPALINNFNTHLKKTMDFGLKCKKDFINVIVAIDGQLITEKISVEPKIVEGFAVSDVDRDILKIVVVNRYKNTNPSVSFIKNFGLKSGAIASSIAHDSHNIICVGVTDEDICNAVNLIIKNKGGICVVDKREELILPLPIAGIISNREYEWVAERYVELNEKARKLGTSLKSPFMTLSFMGLTVIPKIKLSDMGLFDSEHFKFIDVCE